MRKPERPPAGRHPAGNDRPEEKEKKTSFDHLRENLEAVAVAVVLALIIRHFSVETAAPNSTSGSGATRRRESSA